MSTHPATLTTPPVTRRPAGGRILTVAGHPGQARRVAALELTPGLHLARGRRYCPARLTDDGGWYACCEDDPTWPDVCPHRPRWAWRLLTTAGLDIYPTGFEQPVAAVRAAAADLARLPIPWTDTNLVRQRAAVAGKVRTQALDIVFRLDDGGYTRDTATQPATAQPR